MKIVCIQNINVIQWTIRLRSEKRRREIEEFMEQSPVFVDKQVMLQLNDGVAECVPYNGN